MRAIIFANGDFCPDDAGISVDSDDLIIAANGGSEHCATLNLKPDLLIGDLDSMDQDLLSAWQSNGVEIISYPADKDQTDLELALLYAQSQQVSEIFVYGAAGGRLDMTIGNLTLLAHPDLLKPITLICGDEEVHLLLSGETLTLRGKPGETVSLIPLQEGSSQVTTAGLKYPLNGEDLVFGYTRGISNQMVSDQALINLARGTLAIIHIRDHKVENIK